MIHGAALQEMLQRLHDADVERAIADRHNDVLRDPPQLFERFIDVTLHAFVEVADIRNGNVTASAAAFYVINRSLSE